MIYTHAAFFIAGLIVAATAQAWRYDAQIADLQTKYTTANLKRSEVARADENQTARKESTHAADTSKNSDEFTISQPVRDAIARADLAFAERMRLGAERRAATYHAQAQADAAACRDLADRHAAFDAHIVRGAGVVAGLREDLGRRDAEVKLLRGQIDADRALLETE